MREDMFQCPISAKYLSSLLSATFNQRILILIIAVVRNISRKNLRGPYATHKLAPLVISKPSNSCWWMAQLGKEQESLHQKGEIETISRPCEISSNQVLAGRLHSPVWHVAI